MIYAQNATKERGVASIEFSSLKITTHECKGKVFSSPSYE